MKKTIALLAVFALAGCNSGPLGPTVQKMGPVTVVAANFDYHQTLALPDGTEFEFRHAGWEEALTDVGSVVEIQFTGDLHSDHFDNHVISVKVLKHSDNYIKNHPELWPPRNGHWEGSAFVLDDGTKRICGSLEDNRSIGDGWAATVDGQVGRSSLYSKFIDKKSAIEAVEKACK